MKTYNKIYTNLYEETQRYLEAKFPEAGSDVVMEAAAWMAARTLVAVNDSYIFFMNRYETPVRKPSRASEEDIERGNKRRADIMKECEK